MTCPFSRCRVSYDASFLWPASHFHYRLQHPATRVLEREAELVGRIQSRWRGLIVRRYMIVFRRELKRQRERRAGMALRLQRTVRMWSHRRYADKWRSQRAGERLLTAYLETKNAERSDAACTSGMNRLARAYMTERCGMYLGINYSQTEMVPVFAFTLCRLDVQ